MKDYKIRQPLLNEPKVNKANVKQTKWQPHQLPIIPIIPVLLLLLPLPPHTFLLNGKSARNGVFSLPAKRHTFLFTELLPHHPAHNPDPSGIKTWRLLVGGCTHQAHQHLRSLPPPLPHNLHTSGVETIPPWMVRVFMTCTAMMKCQTSPPFA